MNFVRRRRNPANTAGGGCVQHAHPLFMVTDAVDAAAAAQAPKTGSSSTVQLSIQEESMRLQPTITLVFGFHQHTLLTSPVRQIQGGPHASQQRWLDCVDVQNSCAAHNHLVEIANLGWVGAVVSPRWRGCVRDGGHHNLNMQM
jgi:hypothetical protein